MHNYLIIVAIWDVTGADAHHGPHCIRMLCQHESMWGMTLGLLKASEGDSGDWKHGFWVRQSRGVAVTIHKTICRTRQWKHIVQSMGDSKLQVAIPPSNALYFAHFYKALCNIVTEDLQKGATAKNLMSAMDELKTNSESFPWKNLKKLGSLNVVYDTFVANTDAFAQVRKHKRDPEVSSMFGSVWEADALAHSCDSTDIVQEMVRISRRLQRRGQLMVPNLQ